MTTKWDTAYETYDISPTYSSTGDSIKPLPTPNRMQPMNTSVTEPAKYSMGYAMMCGTFTTYMARFRPSHAANGPENSELIAWNMKIMLPDRGATNKKKHRTNGQWILMCWILPTATYPAMRLGSRLFVGIRLHYWLDLCRSMLEWQWHCMTPIDPNQTWADSSPCQQLSGSRMQFNFVGTTILGEMSMISFEILLSDVSALRDISQGELRISHVIHLNLCAQHFINWACTGKCLTMLK